MSNDSPASFSARAAEVLDRSAQAPPRPSLSLRGVGLAVLGWTLYALLYATLLTRAEAVPFVGALLGQIVECVLLGAASVPVWWLTVRQMDGAAAWRVVLVHLALGPLYAWGTVEAYLALMQAAVGPAITGQIAERYGWVLFTHGTLYVVQFTIYHLVRSAQRLRWREQQATELLARAREQELAALKAQVNPHFLFNTLNSISATVPHAPEEARTMIAGLAELLRYALDSTRTDTVTLRDELQFARAYLDLETHRFSDRLQVEYDVAVDDDVLGRSMPPMVLQPLVENAIKHGIAPSEQGGTVRLAVTPQNGHLRVCVEDTGVGPDTDTPLAADDGVGLANTDARLERTFGPEASLHTEALSPRGFRVWFDVPRPASSPSSSDASTTSNQELSAHA